MKSAFVSATTAAALLSTAHGADLANGAYDNADACAEKILQGSPTLPKDWVQDGVNNLVGGRENGVWVGFVSGAGTLIPDISMMDGPQGVRNIFSGVEFPTRTSWASAASVGQGWSPEIAYYVGKYQAQETKITGANMALSPGVEIHRVPTNGRNWEYVAGEDATLGVLGRDVTRGLHSEKVLTSIKHYVTQTQELARTRYVAIIDEATLMETYIRPFIPSIQEGTSAVMCAYSKIQVKEHPETSAWLCGSEHVTNGLLRNVLGFKGAVLTDWSAEAKTSTNGVETVNRMAFDWEMKWGSNPDKPVPAGDTAAQRQITKNTLVAMLASGVMEKPAVCSAEPASPVYTPALDDVPEAYKEAFKSTAGTATVQVAESMVLLKNEGVLPLPVKPTKVLLMGEALLTGGGSGDSAAFAYQFPDKKGEATANNGGPFAQARMKEKVTDALGAGAVVHWNFEASKLALDEYDVIISFASNYRSGKSAFTHNHIQLVSIEHVASIYTYQ
jgi:beta-glucosidase-like glycosyl hydrolase